MSKRREIFNIATHEILETIKRYPGIKKTDVYPYLKATSSETARLQIDQMVEDGLLTETEHGLHQKKTYKLTEYGYKVAEAMSNLQNVINGKGEKREAEDFSAATSEIKRNKIID